MNPGSEFAYPLLGMFLGNEHISLLVLLMFLATGYFYDSIPHRPLRGSNNIVHVGLATVAMRMGVDIPDI